MACDPTCQKEIIAMADSAAGAFTFITWSISLFQIGKHLKHYTNSYFQNKIISFFPSPNSEISDFDNSDYFHGTILCIDILFNTLLSGNLRRVEIFK